MRRNDYAPVMNCLATENHRGAGDIYGTQYNADSPRPQIQTEKNPNALPASFCTLIYQRVPTYALCGDPGHYGHRHRNQALKQKHVQINCHKLISAMVIDIDHSDGIIAWSDACLPQPNCIVSNRDNQKCHYIYMLSAPVAKSAQARSHPLRYLAAIHHTYNKLLDGDQGYVNLICKNPLSNHYHKTYGHDHQYSLGELAHRCGKLLDKPAEPVEKRQGMHRNPTLFDELRYWSYAQVNKFRADSYYLSWCNAVHDRAEEINATFNPALPYNEMRQTVKSVADWVWVRYTGNGRRGVMNLADAGVELSLEERQSMGAMYAAEQKRKATEEKILTAISDLKVTSSRVSMRAVARLAGISQANISKHYQHLFINQK